MKLKKYAIRGLIVFAVVVALCMFFSGTIRTITTAKVKLLTPRQGKFSEQVELTGKVVFPAAEPVKLENAQGVSLTVTSVKVQPGSEVEKGDTLFTAEIADYEKNMDTLRQSYNEAAGQLADLERKNANLRLRPTDEAWAEAYTALAEAQNAELDARVTRDALLAVEGLKAENGTLPEGASEELTEAWAAHEAAGKYGVDLLCEPAGDGVRLSVHGTQGHAAYPDGANNALTALLGIVAALPLSPDAPANAAVRALADLFPHGAYGGEGLGIDQADELSGPLTASLNVIDLGEEGLTGKLDCRVPICATYENCCAVAMLNSERNLPRALGESVIASASTSRTRRSASFSHLSTTLRMSPAIMS